MYALAEPLDQLNHLFELANLEHLDRAAPIEAPVASMEPDLNALWLVDVGEPLDEVVQIDEPFEGSACGLDEPANQCWTWRTFTWVARLMSTFKLPCPRCGAP